MNNGPDSAYCLPYFYPSLVRYLPWINEYVESRRKDRQTPFPL